MTTIFKYPLKVTDEQVLSLPKGALLLTVQMQHGVPCLWALVDSKAETEGRQFRIIGTGHPIDAEEVRRLDYVDTFQMEGGALVFHVFERIHGNKRDLG